MAKVVFASGTSHTPLLTIGAAFWREYSARDLKATKLNTLDGRYISYEELLDRVGARYADQATDEVFRNKQKRCEGALDRISKELIASAPDVVVIVTDDESELFSRENTPALSIYYGDTIITRTASSKTLDLESPPPYFDTMAECYAMDKARVFPAMPAFGRELIERLIGKHIDVGAASQVVEPLRSGFGHGIGFVIHRLLQGRTIPVLPVLLNTYYPPNTPLPARCFNVGRALRECIDASPQDLRVAVIASGGLSHFIVEEELDRTVLEALRVGDGDTLCNIPVGALNAGSSEIRNWIVVGGAMQDAPLAWVEYCPLYRTPAGTGVGTAFAVWGNPG
jgi:hypothetical protein